VTQLKYVGRVSVDTTEPALTPKKYVDDRYTLSLKVDASYVNGQVAIAAANLTSQAYVDNQDNQRAHKTAVDAADANYLATTLLGQPNGVATLDGSGFIPSAQLPAVQTVRKPTFVNVTTTFLPAVRECLAINQQEFRAATLTVPDPGYPYQVLTFANLQGGAVNGTAPLNDQTGTSNYGQISILREDGKQYGRTITAGQREFDFWPVLPGVNEDDTPITYPLLTGTTVFNLYIGLYGGTTYTFTNTAFAFYALVYPAF